MRNVLKKILENGVDKGYFKITKIKDLNSSCCLNSDIEIIDFDFVEELLRKKGFETTKSCDALNFLIDKERIDFIEMKSIKSIIIKNRDIKTDSDLEKQFEKFSFNIKIRDSLQIMSDIIRLTDIALNKKEKEL